jgi:hypothetical protein
MYQCLGRHDTLANDYETESDNRQVVTTLNIPLNLASTISILPQRSKVFRASAASEFFFCSSNAVMTSLKSRDKGGKARISSFLRPGNCAHRAPGEPGRIPCAKYACRRIAAIVGCDQLRAVVMARRALRRFGVCRRTRAWPVEE